ncbi:putative ribonuclease H-like domain-containing protein, partial [Tanacetum coccineum]
VVKALYGLHQALRAWYETLANYLLGNGFKRGKIDQTLFIKKQKEDILLVHVYVDDIIFGSTNKELCAGFEKLMKDKFQICSIGELTFFLGLQVHQKEDGIIISQDKYVAEILKKFNYTEVKSASTPVDLEMPLVKDRDADDVDVHLYRSMIWSLMYLTASRPDIMFAVCACARFQVTPKTSHLLAVKRIFKYLKGKPTLGLWYSRDSPFELGAYTDSDYAGATQDRKSTTGGCQFLGNKLISWQCKKKTVVATSTTEAEYVAAASCYGQVGDEAVHKELGDRMERAATTASSLEAEQDSGSGPKCQDTILGDVDAQTRFETTSKSSMIHLSQEVTHLEVGRTTDEHEKVKVDDEAELKKHLVIVKDDDIAIDAIPLATKAPVIVEYKIIKKGIIGHYQLIRADGSSKRYSSMIRMLQDIDREDLQTLWKLVKTKHGDIRPEDEHERVLWGDLKVMFEPDIKSNAWRNLQGYTVTIWKLYDSCGVHFVRFGNVHIFMLVEKRYPLTLITITNMLNKKLQIDYWNEMCYQLLKLMKMNIKFRRGLLGLKRLQGFLKLLLLSTAGEKVYAAELQLLEDILLSKG